MAKRRMFSKDVIDTDFFLEMPMTAQVLYFHLALRADDDGFVSSPKRILRLVGVGEDDLKILIAKNFIIPFDTGVCVIRHWKIHNYIQKDRYNPTIYQEELETLQQDSSGAYSTDTGWIQTGYKLDTQDRLGKVSLGKDNKEINGQVLEITDAQYTVEKGLLYQNPTVEDQPVKTVRRFQKPTIEEIDTYCKERGNNIDANQFYDYYESNGWKVGRNSMKDWKSAVRYWERNDQNKNKKPVRKEQRSDYYTNDVPW